MGRLVHRLRELKKLKRRNRLRLTKSEQAGNTGDDRAQSETSQCPTTRSRLQDRLHPVGSRLFRKAAPAEPGTLGWIQRIQVRRPSEVDSGGRRETRQQVLP